MLYPCWGWSASPLQHQGQAGGPEASDADPWTSRMSRDTRRQEQGMDGPLPMERKQEVVMGGGKGLCHNTSEKHSTTGQPQRKVS